MTVSEVSFLSTITARVRRKEFIAQIMFFIRLNLKGDIQLIFKFFSTRNAANFELKIEKRQFGQPISSNNKFDGRFV
jgi:hypothetical protein